MELLAITGGLQILPYLNMSGTVLSDCQGIVRKLTQRDVLRRNPTSPGYPLLRYCVRSLAPTRTIQRIKEQPERTLVPRSRKTTGEIPGDLPRPPRLPLAHRLPDPLTRSLALHRPRTGPPAGRSPPCPRTHLPLGLPPHTGRLTRRAGGPGPLGGHLGTAGG